MERYKELREDIEKSKGRTEGEKKETKKSAFRKELSREKKSPVFEQEENFEQAQEVENQPLSKKDLKRVKKEARKYNKDGKKKKHILRWIVLALLAIVAFSIFRFITGVSGSLNGKKPEAETFHGVKSANGASNILILGTDQRDYQTSGSARADSIMVLQLDGPSKKPKIVSFMRDTLVDIPDVGTPGYTDVKINTAFGLGEQASGQGAELVRETLKNNFDIDCRYYAMVNFSSFAKVVDGLFPQGVEIDAQFSTIGGQAVTEVEVPDDLNQKPGEELPMQTIKVGKQRMDGRTLLNYARFRKDDENDFGRVKRQQQVMSAIMTQVKSPKTLLNGPYAVGQVIGFTSTDVPNQFIVRKAVSVLMGASKGIEKMTVPNGDNYTPAMDMYGGDGLDVNLTEYQQMIRDFLDKK
ncbi:MAG: LCP family protein [Lactobacillales bacterium]|jgi:LCP family protein required for cell wall assembly|nr:LCP family protein [Lactobacillales bacterium]